MKAFDIDDFISKIRPSIAQSLFHLVFVIQYQLLKKFHAPLEHISVNFDFYHCVRLGLGVI